jgi:hypothetical protein
MAKPEQKSYTDRKPRLALLACRVFEQEIAVHSAGAVHILETQFLDVGLHDRPDELRSKLQAQLVALAKRDDIEAVALAYGLCGLGTAGLRPVRHKLVIPRAHDCITIFMGAKETYAEHQRHCPSCFYYTPGWNREKRVPGPDRLVALKSDLGKTFEPDDVDFLIESEREQWAQHNTATYIDLGTADAEKEADYARRCAEWLGWKFEYIRGNPALLRDLLWGNWDDGRFQIIEPGKQLEHAPTGMIMRASPLPTPHTVP